MIFRDIEAAITLIFSMAVMSPGITAIFGQKC
jgi:hypothetical protein